MNDLISPRLDEIDTEICKEPLNPRAVKEEAGYGLTCEVPSRRPKESDGYWHTRRLTYDVCGLSYRTPQLNVRLLKWHINNRTYERSRIRDCNYVARGHRNLHFVTGSRRVDFDARSEIDPLKFVAVFGLELKPEGV